MSDLNATIESWFASLNEPRADRRAEQLERAWADGGRWVDPPFEGEGREAISRMVDAVYAQYPGCRFRRASAIDTHHDAVRYAWEMIDPDGNALVAGVDVGQLAPDGRLQRISGFFGELPDELAA